MNHESQMVALDKAGSPRLMDSVITRCDNYATIVMHPPPPPSRDSNSQLTFDSGCHFLTVNYSSKQYYLIERENFTNDPFDFPCIDFINLYVYLILVWFNIINDVRNQSRQQQVIRTAMMVPASLYSATAVCRVGVDTVWPPSGSTVVGVSFLPSCCSRLLGGSG
jgi:hypothetical protein